ncbi:MAG: hypothetical protein Q8N23_02260 [Archangium sp.]|nr:hypothetical protein [Archangium sp.]MDP3575356.1 hypothetical protein [Archangium sp.]
MSPEFINALNECWERGGWWQQVVEDKDLILGIRDESLNVYYGGASLIRVDFRGGRIRAQTHYKYLVTSPEAGDYVSFLVGTSGQLEPVAGGGGAQISPNELRELKSNARAHSGEEKSGVHKIALSNRVGVLDLEVAFVAVGGDASQASSEEHSDDGGTLDRIDLAVLEAKTEHPRLIFFEAKHFTNKELRSSRPAPPVFEQLERYEEDLVHYSGQIKETYQRVASNLLALTGKIQTNDERRGLLEKTVEKLEIDTRPQLLVFGFDDDQKKGDAWARHSAKLEAHFKGRYHVRGDPSGFRL